MNALRKISRTATVGVAGAPMGASDGLRVETDPGAED